MFRELDASVDVNRLSWGSLEPRCLLKRRGDQESDGVDEGMHPLGDSAGTNPADSVVQADQSIDVRGRIRVILFNAMF